MTVQSAVYTGDGAITLSPGVSPATPATIAYSAYFVVSLTCTPTTATTYNGSVEIKSDASNLPDIVVYLQCQGIAPTP